MGEGYAQQWTKTMMMIEVFLMTINSISLMVIMQLINEDQLLV